MAGRQSPWCDRCGTPSRFAGDMSCIGICPDCGEWALVDNMHGMTDPQSVVYKQWKMAHRISKMGRPRKYTPTPAEANAIASLLPKKPTSPMA